REKQQAQREGKRRKNQRERSASACLVVDRRLRQAARHGIAMAQCRREVARANSEEFLPWIEAIAMLRRKRACRGNTFDVGKQQTSGSQRNDPLDVAQAQPREFKGWQPRRHLSRGGHPETGKPERRCPPERPP